jgi:hypothetical protein
MTARSANTLPGNFAGALPTKGKMNKVLKLKTQLKLRRQLNEFIRAFGAERGGQLFASGVSLTEALRSESNRLQKLGRAK